MSDCAVRHASLFLCFRGTVGAGKTAAQRRELRLLPGAGGGSPARRGAWGERGGCPSTPPAPPYSPFCGSAKAVSLAGLYLVRRVSRGRRREPSRPFRPGDVRACCGAPFALRASGIAFAPAPSLQQRQRRRGCPAGGRQGMSDGQGEHRRRQGGNSCGRRWDCTGDGRRRENGGAAPGIAAAARSGRQVACPARGMG